jgi:hypothetical protein
MSKPPQMPAVRRDDAQDTVITPWLFQAAVVPGARSVPAGNNVNHNEIYCGPDPANMGNFIYCTGRNEYCQDTSNCVQAAPATKMAGGTCHQFSYTDGTHTFGVQS